MRAARLAQSTNRERNLRASSGGIIKEVVAALLGKPEVTGAIALGHAGGLAFEPRLITRPEQVDELVAIPCQFEGIYTHIFRHEPALAKRIHTTVGLICGWQYTHHALRAIELRPRVGRRESAVSH
ncbi:MAG: coenzyme F420 hydrogenase/dehydrogenase beta subunit N-terminal domain-containing protein [Planctomycetota bacterium]